MIRKQAFIEVGGFEESMTHAEDWDMWMRLSAKYHFIAVASPQVLYRVSPNSASANLAMLEAGYLQMLERALINAPPSLQHLKKYSAAHFYKGLSCKAFVCCPPGRQRGLTSAKFLWRAVLNDLSLLRQVKFMLIMLFKIGVTIVLAPQQTEALLYSLKSSYKNNFRLQDKNIF